MSLKDYLTKYFTGEKGIFEDKEVSICEHFMERFGVNVKIENDLFMFKYDMLFVKFGIPLTKECRGHIYQYKNSNWKCVCNGMDKFWNIDEGYSPLFAENDFQMYRNQIQLKSKEDGSLIHVYNVDGVWRVSSSGSITTFFVGDSKLTFEQLFWQTIKMDKDIFLSKLNKDYTYIFELCSTLNAIVSIYANDRVYLLNIRHNEYGTYLPIDDLALELGVMVPKSVFVYELNVKTKEDLILWVENQCIDDIDCKYKEGFVAYVNSVPCAKIKSAKYKFLHSFKGNNDKETRNNIIDAYFCESLDDVYNSLHDSSKLFAETLRLKVIDLTNQVNNCIIDMKDKTFSTQKDYAMYVINISKVPKMIQAFFFQNKDTIIAGNYSQEMFTGWIKNNYKKFIDHWKA